MDLLSSGGAGLNPYELQAEGVIHDFLALHVDYQLKRFSKFWARLPESFTAYVDWVLPIVPRMVMPQSLWVGA